MRYVKEDVMNYKLDSSVRIIYYDMENISMETDFLRTHLNTITAMVHSCIKTHLVTTRVLAFTRREI